MNRITKIIRFLVDLIYPNRCPCCGDYILWNKYLCSGCIDKVRVDRKYLCYRCGRTKAECTCAGMLFFDGVFSVSYYENEARDGLLALKTGRNRNFGYFTGQELGNRIAARYDWMQADGIVAVPMRPLKRFIRGYNQTELIAKEISRITGIPVLDKCITKKGGYRAQHTLSAHERDENADCFVSAGRDLEDKVIILCDDIMTTGSTIRHCEKILRDCGAVKVYVAVAAVTRMIKTEEKEKKYYGLE